MMKGFVMELIDFSQFAARRAARMQPTEVSSAAIQALVGDHWDQLHVAADVEAADVEADDFWDDLQFRLAYPTHRLRAY